MPSERVNANLPAGPRLSSPIFASVLRSYAKLWALAVTTVPASAPSEQVAAIQVEESLGGWLLSAEAETKRAGLRTAAGSDCHGNQQADYSITESL